jgi:hypothetical protein
VYIYALSYRNPYQPDELFALFLASERLLATPEALGKAAEAVARDGVGNEMVEAVTQGALCGPLQVSGQLSDPSIAVVVK